MYVFVVSLNKAEKYIYAFYYACSEYNLVLKNEIKQCNCSVFITKKGFLKT